MLPPIEQHFKIMGPKKSVSSKRRKEICLQQTVMERSNLFSDSKKKIKCYNLCLPEVPMMKAETLRMILSLTGAISQPTFLSVTSS